MKSPVLQSLHNLPQQARQAFDEVLALSVEQKPINRVILMGMGGSGLGAQILHSVFHLDFPVTLELSREYEVPRSIDEQTLVIVTSYSGGTEEALMIFQQAVKAKAQVVALTIGGQLAQLAMEHGCLLYQFDPRHNPCGMPRYATGYTLFAIAGFLQQFGLLQMSSDVDLAIKQMQERVETYDDLQELAKHLQQRMPIFLSAEHLVGNGKVAINQMNENAKSLAGFFDLPELNHHLLEGLGHPKEVIEHVTLIELQSDLYLARNQKRFAITKQVAQEQGIDWQVLQAKGTSSFAQACDIMCATSFLSYQLAMLYEIDPVEIPWVDFFKRELSK